MSFATLPDLCILLIFDRIPLSDLCSTVNRVCRRWNALQSSACLRRRTINLVEDEHFALQHVATGSLVRFCEHKFPSPIVPDDHTLDADGSSLSPVQKFLDLNHNQSTVRHDSLVISQLRANVAHKLMAAFSVNVTTLRVIYPNFSWHQISVIQSLLDGWSATLKHLKLMIQIEDNEWLVSGDRYQRCFNQLFVSLNRLQSLRHLELHLELPWQYRITLSELPIIERLETFIFDSVGFVQSRAHTTERNSTMLSLLNHLEADGSLKSHLKICYYKGTQIDQLLQLDGGLAQKFTELRFALDCDFDRFYRFCGHFHLLTALEMVRLGDGTITVGQLSVALTQLPQLVFLGIDADFSTLTPNAENDQLLYSSSSVKTVHLLAKIAHSHTDLRMLHFAALFPNVQLLWLNVFADQCLRCGLHWNEYDPGLVDGKLTEQEEPYECCLSQLRAQFRECAQLVVMRFAFTNYTFYHNLKRHHYVARKNLFAREDL